MKSKEEYIYNDEKSKTDVFISYKSGNVDFVNEVVSELTDHYISVWFDKDKLTHEVGEEYPELISKGIDHAQIVLFIYTKDTENSPFIIEKELGYAKAKGKKICCYAQEEVDFNIMESSLKAIVHDIQWLADSKKAEHITQYQESIKDEKKRLALAATIQDFSTSSSIYKDINLFLIRIAIQRLLGHPTPYGTYNLLCKSETIYDEANGIDMIVENLALYIPIPEDKKTILKDLKFHKEYDELEKDERETTDLLKNLSLDKTTMMQILKTYISDNYSYSDIHEWVSINHNDITLPSKDKFSFDDFISIVSVITADGFIEQIRTKNKTMFNGAMLGIYDIKDYRTGNVEKHELGIRMYHSDYFTFKCMVEVYHILRSIRNTFHFEDIKADIKKYSPFLCSLGLGGFVIAEQDDYQTIMWAKRANTISSGDMWHFSYDETVSLLKDSVRTGKDGNSGEIMILDENKIRINPYKNFYRALYEENGLKEENIGQDRGILSIGLITSERLEIELLSYASVKLTSGASIPMQMRKFHNSAPDGYLEISKYEFRSLNDSVNNYIGRLLTPESHFLAEVIQQDKQQLLTGSGGRKDLKIGKMVQIGKNVKIGKNCLIEDFSTLSDNCSIGDKCKIHRNVFIDEGVKIGNYVKIQNNNSIYHGVTIAEGAFIGTNVSFTNDIWPRSITLNGEPVTTDDWELMETHVGYGASIGAGAVIRCGVTIGERAMIGCGAIVTHDVPAYSVVYGPGAEVHRKCNK